MNTKALILVAAMSCAAAANAEVAITNEVAATMVVVTAGPLLTTVGSQSERVTPLLVAVIGEHEPSFAYVYCVGHRISWRCHNLKPLDIFTIAGHLDTGLRLSNRDGTDYHVIPLAVAIDSFRRDGSFLD